MSVFYIPEGTRVLLIKDGHGKGYTLRRNLEFKDRIPHDGKLAFRYEEYLILVDPENVEISVLIVDAVKKGIQQLTEMTVAPGEEDGIGFNRYDKEKGMRLYKKKLTTMDVLEGAKLIWKYRKQLKSEIVDMAADCLAKRQ